MKSIIAIAKKIYENTSYKPLRGFYYRAFCAIVRNRTVCASIDGINYKLDLGEVIDVGIYLNKYEPDVTAAIERLCRPGFTVLDIGANVGSHTLRLARNVGESGKVCAFEPTDYAYKKLLHNISLNPFKNITPVQVVLSDKNLLRQSIRFRSSWPTGGGGAIQKESVVDFIRLDDWCRSKKLEHVDLIKLDVDGNEYSVIMGAESLLNRQRPLIIMEVWGPNFSEESKNPFIALMKMGYKFYDIVTGKEYVSIDDLRSKVSLEGKLLDYAMNIIAKHNNSCGATKC
jgi:FkbM family methyltransferase